MERSGWKARSETGVFSPSPCLCQKEREGILIFDQSSTERCKHILILMLTTKTQKKDVLLRIETGADDYITKPFDINRLIKKVKNFLKNS